jgi:hypothetical protein
VCELLVGVVRVVAILAWADCVTQSAPTIATLPIVRAARKNT